MKKLVLIYNADSGYISAAVDALHKMLSPQTYLCNLCAVTHGPFGMKAAWRRFIDSLGVEVVFLHRDQYLASGGRADIHLPAILINDEDGQSTVLLDAKAINSAVTISDLERLIKDALKAQITSAGS